MKIILLNGPAQCGKDTAAGVIMNRATRKTVHTKLAIDLKMRCHAAYGLWHKGMPLHHNAFEKAKDEPQECFEGLSPREAYIAFFENWLIPTHGESMLGVWLVRRLQRVLEIEAAAKAHGGKTAETFAPTEFAVISDCRRVEDVSPLQSVFGPESLTILRIHREDHDWTDDIGSYLDFKTIRCVDVKNPESIIDGLFINLRDAIPEVFAPKIILEAP